MTGLLPQALLPEPGHVEVHDVGDIDKPPSDGVATLLERDQQVCGAVLDLEDQAIGGKPKGEGVLEERLRYLDQGWAVTHEVLQTHASEHAHKVGRVGGSVGALEQKLVGEDA